MLTQQYRISIPEGDVIISSYTPQIIEWYVCTRLNLTKICHLQHIKIKQL